MCTWFGDRSFFVVERLQECCSVDTTSLDLTVQQKCWKVLDYDFLGTLHDGLTTKFFVRPTLRNGTWVGKNEKLYK